MQLTKKEREALEFCAIHSDAGWLPWRGTLTAAKRLHKLELIKVGGQSVMPPYTLYFITDAGRAALDKQH